MSATTNLGRRQPPVDNAVNVLADVPNTALTLRQTFARTEAD